MSSIKVDGIKKALKAYSKETGMRPYTTQIQYKEFSKPPYYEYTNSALLIRFKHNMFSTKSNIKLFSDSPSTKFPTTDHLFLNFTEGNKIQTFNTRLLLDNIRKLEKKTRKHTTKKLKNIVL